MYQAIAAALGLTALVARVSLGYGPMDCCAPPPCGCEPVACCDPCAGVVSEPAPPKAPGTLPAPKNRVTPPAPTPAEEPATQRTTNEFPSPPNVNTPTPVETPQPTLPTDEPPPAEPLTAEAEPTAPPAEDEPAEPPVAVEEPTRYSAPPADEPAAAPPETDPYAELFPPDPATSEPEHPSDDVPPATEEAPPAAEEAPATDEAPPDYNELFPPSSFLDVLSTPGGLASDSPRPWTNVHGHPLLTARVTKVRPTRIVVTCEDGVSHTLAFSELSKHDLAFVRRQVDARQVQLAHEARQQELLANQGR
ncbi:MAG TPA: hypothetical protein VF175_03430 [Lacipirellula sp.]